jgi:hypothetical protein
LCGKEKTFQVEGGGAALEMCGLVICLAGKGRDIGLLFITGITSDKDLSRKGCTSLTISLTRFVSFSPIIHKIC